jgi:hypothetical protein
MTVEPGPSFPRFLMKIGEEKKFLSLHKAALALSDERGPVDILGLALECDLTVRDISTEEMLRIVTISDALKRNRS